MQRFLFLAALVASAPVLAHDVDPFGFEQQHAPSTLTRAEARAQSKMAQPVTMRIDDAGRLITAPSTKPRAQVAAETAAAARMGLIRHGEVGLVQPTDAQEREIGLAGMRAAGLTSAMQ